MDDNSVDYKNSLWPHPVWRLDKVTQLKESDTRIYELFNLDLEKNNSLSSKRLKPKHSTIARFDLHIKRSPLFIMINGVVPSFILNLVILLAFSLSFDTQIGLCK